MKRLSLIALALVLTLGTVQGLNKQARKLNSMISHTSIVSQNDDDCCGMSTIQSIYRQDKAIQDSYDGNDIYVYVYHCLDNQGLSHNEIEINTNRDQFRYDL